MEKTCLTCNSKFTGRADKKYCNEACKNDYHNQKSSGKSVNGKQQFLLAKRNHGILSRIEAAGIDQIGIKELEVCGFNFEGITGMKNPASGTPRLYCFDFSLQLYGNYYRIRKR